MRKADQMAMDGFRALTDAHRGMRMKAAHEKRGLAAPGNVSPMHAPGQKAQQPPGAPAPGTEDDFMGTPEYDRMLAELCAKG